MAARFRSMNATPPQGCYEYACGGTVVTAKTRNEITRLASDVRRSQGLPVIGDPFTYVMEYMCPGMPNGFCTEPSKIRYMPADVIKANTSALFGMPTVPQDISTARLCVCIGCKDHVTTGFCMGCNGLLDWIYRGFGSRRGKLLPDPATGVCPHDAAFVAATAVVDRPYVDGADELRYPSHCWRRKPGDQK